MYIKGIDKRIFSDFKETYLLELIKKYPGKSVLNKIFKDINEIKISLNLQALTKLNINYWLVRGWDEKESLEHVNKIKSARKKPKYTCLCIEFWIKRGFSEEEAINKIKEIQRNNNNKLNEKRKANPKKYKSNSPMTLKFWVDKGFSEEEAINKIKSQRKLNKEYWINKGFSEKESIVKVKKFQKENGDKFAKKRKENPKKYKNSLNIDYYIAKGFTKEEAELQLKERQATGRLDKYIKKYGEEGFRKWKERQEKWKAKVFNTTTCISSGYSMLSLNIINEIQKIHTTILCNSREKFIYDKQYKRAYKYDITKLDNKKIIEINGIFWHCKPTIYKKDYFHKVRKLTAKEIWEFDKRKIDLAKEHGYDVLVIWEDDYYNDPDKIINECINFLK